MSAGTSLNCYTIIWILLIVAVSSTQGSCEFKKSWIGRWFQSGVQNLLYINSTHIETKGECYEEQGDKYLVYDKTEDCYRCMAIHEKHQSVLQYKETYCDQKAPLQEVCYGITGDAPLISMFRKHPEAKPVPCPFKSAPFTFSYNKGVGDCNNPPSKAESCTDDSRLVLKYQACPDVPSTESNVEELVCLATWKEGSTRYLIGRISQGNRRNSLTSDEDQYRCFIYQRNTENGKSIYNIAQSGDATCSGLQNAFEGSKTMKLTTVDNHHNRCKFPIWITEHHTWLSLDHHKTYKFSQRNATLKILDDEMITTSSNNNNNNNNNNGGSQQQNKQQQQPEQQIYAQPYAFQQFGFESQDQRKQNSEMRVICHSILESVEQKKVQIVAHITAGCNSGYVCMVFYKRDANVIEIQQQSDNNYVENPDEACANFNQMTTPFTTLITTTLHAKKCPHLGRYSLLVPQSHNNLNNARRKRRGDHHRQQQSKQQQQQQQQQQLLLKDNVGNSDSVVGNSGSSDIGTIINQASNNDCLSYDYAALAVGCAKTNEMEFRSNCVQQAISAYSCHGNWEENGVYYMIASPISRRSTDALRYCFIYTLGTSNSNNNLQNQQQQNHNHNYQQHQGDLTTVILDGGGGVGKTNFSPLILRLSGVAESCHRHIVPGVNGNWAFNFTSNGTCAQNESDSSSSIALPPTLLFIILLSIFVTTITR